MIILVSRFEPLVSMDWKERDSPLQDDDGNFVLTMPRTLTKVGHINDVEKSRIGR